MTPEQFVNWLDGFMEACGDQPTPEQWKQIKAKRKAVLASGSAPRRSPYELPKW